MSGLGCAVRLRHEYFHQFHAYAFSHHTRISYVVRDDFVYFENSGVNMIAWGKGNAETQAKRQVARDIGIIPPGGTNMTQRRITEFFARAENANHPQRFMFATELGE